MHTAYGQLYRFDNLIDGTSTIYEYDPTGRLVHFTEFDSDTMVNEFSSLIYYDAEGRIDYYDYIGAYASSSGVNDWSTTYRISFLNDGRLNGFSLDAKSNITTETATASVHFTYDKYNRPTSKAYTYSAPSQSFTGSASYTYTDTAISTSSQVATYTSTVGSSTVTSTYTYDGNGFITKITLSTGAEYRYVYDDLGQLLREDNTVTNKTYVYEYDDAGNITSKKTYFLTAEGATPTSPISTITYGYTDPLGWGDLLTSYRGVTITYDAIGNPLTYYNGNSYTFEWENGRQLAAVSSDDLELEFAYNDEGIRTQKIANGAVHTYHLSGSQIISEEWGNHLLVYLYDSNGSPMGMQYRRSSMAEDVFYTFWFEKNLQGDIVAVYNSAGTKVVSYAYDAWGNCIATNHNISGTNSYANLNPFRYRGYYYDTELGFYYLNSRYYDPAVGRFINADVYINANGGFIGFNMFAYCNNMPINYRDPSGALMIDTSEPDTWTNYTLDQIAFIKSKTSNPYAEEEEIIRNFEAYVQSEADAHGMDYQETEDAILWSIISGEPWQYYNTTFEDLATVYLTNYAACSATDFSNVSQAMAGATASGVLTNNWISDLESDCRIYNRKPMDKFKAMAISTVASVADTINTMACLCFQAPPSVGASVSTVIYYGKQFLKKVLVGY